MTAEVCLMNAFGVALAADSAVTIGGGRSPKVYNSADKLFLLSEQAPIGAMIYGGARLVTVPWETLVKDYRRQTSLVPETLTAFADDFIAYLSRQSALFTESVQVDVVAGHAQATFRGIVERLKDQLHAEMDRRGPLPEPEVRKTLRRLADQETAKWLAEVREAPMLSRPPTKTSLARRYAEVISEVHSQIFQDLPLSRLARSTARECVFEALRREMFTEAASGFVIAGFGREDIFPTVVDFMVNDVVGDRVRWGRRRVSAITHTQPALVLPFAQMEMVYAFMEGIDPRLERLTKEVVERLLRLLPEILAQATAPQQSEAGTAPTPHPKAVERVEALIPKLWNELAKFRSRAFSDPVATIVSVLPKDELGAMAEALVNLTSFRRRVTTDFETVGGPIDVAVISKGDGFVWIKRKHYFDPALNPRHVAQHYRVPR